jgi:hypothetical protein
VRQQIACLELDELKRPQPRAVLHLEHGGVPPGDRSALVVRAHHLLDPVIDVVEQGAKLVAADLAPLGAMVILLDMPGGIPLMADLLRNLAELLQAAFEPGDTAD